MILINIIFLKYVSFYFCYVSQTKIDSGFFLYEAEIKSKKEKKDQKANSCSRDAKVSRLGGMFLDINPDSSFYSSSSSSSSDEDFITYRKEKRV